MLILTDTSLFADPETYENFDDQTEDLQTLTFDDLLNFAFQVAKGMEFLSSKNVRDEGPHKGNILPALFTQAEIQLKLFASHGLMSSNIRYSRLVD